MPSFCAAAAIGWTGKPTIPNMNSTPCFLRLLATSVAPSTSAMSSSFLSGRQDNRLARRLRVEDPVGLLGLFELPSVREQHLDVDLPVGDELGALRLALLRERPGADERHLPPQEIRTDVQRDL